jgi:hypothetical protein
MIHINFGLSNPWGAPFDNLWNRSGRVTKNTSWELELLKGQQLIGFEFGYTMRCSHAGLRLELALLGYSVAFQTYDNRHWNYSTNDWEVYADNHPGS